MACWHDPTQAGKPILLMGHGNGLSALCQIDLMRALSVQFDVHAIDFRGHGETAGHLPLPTSPLNTWGFFQRDLTHVIDVHFGGKVAYAGHSLGGVLALRLAHKRPEAFSNLIAIDPAILPPNLARIYPLVRLSHHLSLRNHLYAGALKRRLEWPDRKTALAYFTGRKALATWPAEAVEAYISSCLKEHTNGTLTLKCPREWEARTFRFVAAETGYILRKIKISTLIIRAKGGSIYPKSLKLGPNMQMLNVPGSHFAHLEKPELVSKAIQGFLRRGK